MLLIVVLYCALAWVSMWAFLVPSRPNELDSDHRNEDWNE